MKIRTRLLALLALPIACLTTPIGAQTLAPQPAGPLSAEQKTSLDRSLRLWTGMPLPATEFAERLLQLHAAVPEGDHYRILIDPNLQMGSQVVEGGRLAATARPLSGGRWRFDDVQTSMPLIVNNWAAGGQRASQITIDMQGQTGHAVIDPSLATPSTFDGAATTTTGTFNSPPAFAGSFRTGAITTHGVWRPAGPGRIDRSSAAAISDLAMQVTGKQAVSITAGAMHGEARITGLSPDRLADTMAFLRANLPTTAPPQPGAAGEKSSRLTAADRQAMHTALDHLRAVATRLEADATFEDVAVVSAGHTVRFHQIGLAQGFAAPGGRFEATLRASFDGLSSPDIPPDAGAYVPHHLLVSPRLSGVSVDAVFAALGALVDEGIVDDRHPDALRQRGRAILAKSPVSLGLDALAFDIGPATLAASGAVTIAGGRTQDLTGSATVEVKGFNALLRRANTDKLLQQAAPVLIFLKGIGDEQDNGTVVWRVSYVGGHISVNGTDLSQMLRRK